MATHFTKEFQNLKQSFSSFLDIDSNMQIISNFPQHGFHNLGEFSLEKLPVIPGPNFLEISLKCFQIPRMLRRNISSLLQSSGKEKRARTSENGEKKEEVVHVRARRGQATDSHSLAERDRRGKINERLKFLQSIVPGCYKTMGMALMLDEIIS
ncbi:hypothetical protein LIER_17977 [Lithospermum erythrorhizon]|uniref:BHLH domain-containing protein n=1 Tax=Lithospermum erythrorhizon TaxID=34254 RepID=A0AAV3QHV3_LITER